MRSARSSWTPSVRNLRARRRASDLAARRGRDLADRACRQSARRFSGLAAPPDHTQVPSLERRSREDNGHGGSDAKLRKASSRTRVGVTWCDLLAREPKEARHACSGPRDPLDGLAADLRLRWMAYNLPESGRCWLAARSRSSPFSPSLPAPMTRRPAAVRVRAARLGQVAALAAAAMARAAPRAATVQATRLAVEPRAVQAAAQKPHASTCSRATPRRPTRVSSATGTTSRAPSRRRASPITAVATCFTTPATPCG